MEDQDKSQESLAATSSRNLNDNENTSDLHEKKMQPLSI